MSTFRIKDLMIQVVPNAEAICPAPTCEGTGIERVDGLCVPGSNGCGCTQTCVITFVPKCQANACTHCSGKASGCLATLCADGCSKACTLRIYTECGDGCSNYCSKGNCSLPCTFCTWPSGRPVGSTRADLATLKRQLKERLAEIEREEDLALPATKPSVQDLKRLETELSGALDMVRRQRSNLTGKRGRSRKSTRKPRGKKK